MARPNNAAAISGHIQGLREAKAAFQALPEIVRDASLDATETTVREIARGAQARILANPSVQTRSLHDHIAWKVTKTNGRGRVGIASGETRMVVNGRKVKVKGIVVAGKGGSAKTSAGAKLIKPSRYGPKVEFGTRHMKAEPFMVPAAESQREPYLQRMIRAGQQIERNTAAIGMRNL
jgi:HK97 gp10 family phage protein